MNYVHDDRPYLSSTNYLTQYRNIKSYVTSDGTTLTHIFKNWILVLKIFIKYLMFSQYIYIYISLSLYNCAHFEILIFTFIIYVEFNYASFLLKKKKKKTFVLPTFDCYIICTSFFLYKKKKSPNLYSALLKLFCTLAPAYVTQKNLRTLSITWFFKKKKLQIR